MKYEYYPKRRTEQERRELNEQIIRLLQSEACEQAGVTDEDIFNRYTGDGGLHGLRRSDYENYNAFSAAKKELENGQFFTPPPLCEMIVSALRLTDTDLVADLTCGMGNFFNFLPNERNAYGCEVDPNACAVARKLYPQAHIVQGDIRDYEPQTHFDFVLGNPPFHLRWIMPDATIMTSHQYYCLKAAKLLKPLGILAVIVPASFLADSFSDKGAIRMMESRFSFLGQVMLPEHAFSDSGVDDFPTKLQFWQKKSTAADWTPKRYSTDCSDIYIPSGHPVMAATALYEKFVMVAKADLAGNRNKVFLELAQLKTTKSTFLYQVKKYLYQIRSHPATREKYDACFAYVHRFYTQRQPADMPYDEWQRVQLTEAKVLAYLKQALCRQNAKPERDEIRLVKQKHSFVYKAYSRKMAKLLTDEMRAPVPIYQAVLNDEPERFPGYERLLRRKRREYDNQEQPFSEMTENAQLADWIGRFQYWDAQNHAYIHLNPLQSHDVNLTLQKRYAFLQWEQGSGKTPAAIFTGKHRVEMGAVHSIWVISSAISIRNNWDVILKGAGFSYVFVERLADLQRIRPGDFVILTLNKVSQYKKQIGRYIKQLGYKIQFIFDESDNISNPSSKQTLSVLSCFRRCKYTRTFEEVTGKDIRRIHQMPIPFLPEEREVYNIVLKEFYRIQREYYNSTGNSRKDALMRLIQQITLLLRISAAPDCMKEYEGETPLKEMAVVEALARWPEEVVAIGVRHTTVLDRYAAAIREYLPERPLFVVTGSTVTFAKRRALREVLRDSQNGILLCTQQSLPSSVNFEFVNKIIIPEMHYNNAGMSQFYMRFVRYTSTEKKDLYFPIYIGSLESNLMQMVLAKEKLTMFMKGQDADMDEIYAKFGVDYDLLSTLMTRETDDEGHLRIHWGEQKIA